MNVNAKISSEATVDWLKSIGVKSTGIASSLIELIISSFVWALVGAVVCLAIVQYFPDAWIAKSERASFDTALNDLASMGLAVANDSDKTQPFAFVDIDEKAFENLGQYTFFPKNKMALFLGNLANSKAKLAVIDIDFSHKEHSIETKMLEEEMRAYANNPQNPPLLLVRHITSSIAGKDEIGTLSESVYDELVEKASHIHWASAVFLSNSEDYIVRKQKQWVATCKNNQLVVLPAVNILVKELLSEKVNTTLSVEDRINEVTKNKYRNICLDKTRLSLLSDLYAELDEKFNLGDDNKKDLIPFLYSPNLSSPIIPAKSEKSYDVPLVGKPDAMALLEANSTVVKQLANKIVVFGVSFLSSNDFINTPLSRMPGSLAIINSINSLLSYGAVRTVDICEAFIAYFILSLISILVVLLIRFASVKIIERTKNTSPIERTKNNPKKFSHYIVLLIAILYDIFIAFGLEGMTKFFVHLSYPFLLNQGIWLNIMTPLKFISLIFSFGSHQGGVRKAGKIILGKLTGNKND